MSREWPSPIRPDAFRVTIVSDMHHGRRSFTADAMAHAGASLDREGPRTDLFLDLGDAIHWRLAEHRPAEDAAAQAWIAQREAATGKPWLSIAGNHDLTSYGSPFPVRTGDEWATDRGLAHRNSVHDHEEWVRVVMVTPRHWGYDETKPGHEPMHLAPDEIAWIEDQANAVPERMVLLGIHSPPGPHYGGHVDEQTATRLGDMLGRTPNVVAFMSGHRHVNLDTDTRCFIDLEAGGRTLHWINVPSFGGVTPGFPHDRWGQPFYATHLSVFRDGSVEVRCRDHMHGRWVPWAMTGFVTRLPAPQN